MSRIYLKRTYIQFETISAMDASKVFVTCSLLTASTIAVIWFYCKNKKGKLPTEWIKVGRVSELFMYPLKSGFRMDLKEAECTYLGLRQVMDTNAFKLRDRFLIVYKGEDNEFRTGRTHPKMVLIEISNHDVDHVALDAPGMRTLYVQIPTLSDNKTLCKLHNKEKTELIDCGNEASSWLSRYILDKESGLRLGYHDETMNIRKTPPGLLKFYPNIRNKDMGIFSDLSSYMLINKTSIADLNEHLEKDVTGTQFRPNIMIDDVQSPYVEDGWDWIKIGDEAVFRNIKPCTRCVFISIDADTGVMDAKREPLKTMKTYRQLPDEEERKASKNSPVMGINLGLRNPGIIKVNDIVYVGKH